VKLWKDAKIARGIKLPGDGNNAGERASDSIVRLQRDAESERTVTVTAVGRGYQTINAELQRTPKRLDRARGHT
jgi:hypothetical protein